MIEKTRRFRSKALLAAVRELDCVSCGDPNSEAAHLPTKGSAGIAQKTDDFMCMSLCRSCHLYADGEGRSDYGWKAEMLRRTWKGLLREGAIKI